MYVQLLHVFLIRLLPYEILFLEYIGKNVRSCSFPALLSAPCSHTVISYYSIDHLNPTHALKSPSAIQDFSLDPSVFVSLVGMLT